MSYPCEDNSLVIRVNYFSNPDVTFQDKPTGTVIDDCARRISETKVRVVGVIAPRRWTLATYRQINVTGRASS